jgi:hypothetical protein
VLSAAFKYLTPLNVKGATTVSSSSSLSSSSLSSSFSGSGVAVFLGSGVGSLGGGIAVFLGSLLLASSMRFLIRSSPTLPFSITFFSFGGRPRFLGSAIGFS